MRQAYYLVKPDGIDNFIEIENYIISTGLKIIKKFDYIMSEEDVRFLYSPILITEPFAVEQACKGMKSKLVKLVLCEGGEDIYKILKESKDYLRKFYNKENPTGIMHTPDDKEEAEREIEYFSSIFTS